MKIEGKVWYLPCSESEVADLQLKFRVTNIARTEDSAVVNSGAVNLRVLSDNKPTDAAYNVSPTLEDYYLYIFGENVVGNQT